MSQQQKDTDTEAEQAPVNGAGEPESTEAQDPAEPEVAAADAAEQVDDGTDNSDTSVDAELEQAQDTIKDYWDQIMRLRAEMENNRKRAERDVENAHKYALKNFTENLLPVVDSMEMGLKAAGTDNATLDSIREGSELTLNMLMQVLERSNVQQLDPVGEKFDPELHQAISMIDSADTETNTVIEVMQKGFVLNDRLIRPAMVIVAK